MVDVNASDDPAALRGTEYVIVAVKSYSLAEIASPLTALTAGAESSAPVVVPLLNGVDVADRLAHLGVPRRTILPGIAYISAARIEAGLVARFSNFRRLVVGEENGTLSDRATRFVTGCLAAGIEARASDAIRLDLWRKFLFLAPMAAACGLARRPIGVVRDAPFGRFVIERAVREVANVARASKVRLTEDDENTSIRSLDGLPAGVKPSFLVDVERGGPNELDVLSGTVARLGLALNVDTPVHATVVAAIGALGEEPGK